MSALNFQPILTFFFPCFIRTKKKGSTRSWQGWVIEVKKVLADKIKEIFSIIDLLNILILFINLAVWKPVKESGKLIIDHLAKINIFFSMIHINKKEMLSKVLAKLGCGQN